ncbi:GH18524 [Drosophila grimshawi]|uniref:GH18524 n=1 Tax=Drosophila grimshawi TaxID=7222 RepID=B4JIB0_DROGR|nr:GH18524 [Drosophila grimshawi]
MMQMVDPILKLIGMLMRCTRKEIRRINQRRTANGSPKMQMGNLLHLLNNLVEVVLLLFQLYGLQSKTLLYLSCYPHQWSNSRTSTINLQLG